MKRRRARTNVQHVWVEGSEIRVEHLGLRILGFRVVGLVQGCATCYEACCSGR